MIDLQDPEARRELLAAMVEGAKPIIKRMVIKVAVVGFLCGFSAGLVVAWLWRW